MVFGNCNHEWTYLPFVLGLQVDIRPLLGNEFDSFMKIHAREVVDQRKPKLVRRVNQLAYLKHLQGPLLKFLGQLLKDSKGQLVGHDLQHLVTDAF